MARDYRMNHRRRPSFGGDCLLALISVITLLLAGRSYGAYMGWTDPWQDLLSPGTMASVCVTISMVTMVVSVWRSRFGDGDNH